MKSVLQAILVVTGLAAILSAMASLFSLVPVSAVVSEVSWLGAVVAIGALGIIDAVERQTSTMVRIHQAESMQRAAAMSSPPEEASE